MKTKNYNIFLIAIMLITASLAQGCISDLNTIKGNKDVVSVELTPGAFDAIHISGVFRVFLEEGSTPYVRIETDENIHEYVSASVRSNTLHLETERGQNYNPTRLDVYININQLSSLHISGAASVSSAHTLTSENLKLILSGASNIDLKLDADKVSTSISGAGKVNLAGNAREHRIQISGVGKLECLNLNTADTRVNISGAGSANVHAEESLNASVSGVGRIRYAGNPASLHTSTSGPGSIRPI